MSVVHNFQEKLEKSKETSRMLDEYFGAKYHIYDTPLELDKRGVDRIFVDKETLKTYKIEYKQDSRCNQTGNAFIEVVSVFKDGECKKKGWAHTCEADYLIYHDMVSGKAYPISLSILRESLNDWDCYKRACAYNPGYHSVGILVPMDVFIDKCVGCFNV